MANLLSPLQTGEGRIFINSEGFGGTTSFEFHNCMKIDGLDKTIGEAEPVYCPDPSRYDEFVEVAVIKGAESRWSSSLSGKLYGDRMSPLEILATQRSPVNLQIHYGRCTRPDDFNAFDSAIILEDVRISSYALSALTAANPSERGLIEETSSISAGNMYRIFNPQVVQGKSNMTIGTTGLTGINANECGVSTSVRGVNAQIWAFVQLDDDYMFTYTLDGGTTWVTNTTTTEPGDLSNFMINDGSYFYIGADTKVYRVSVSAVLSGIAPSVETMATLTGVTVKKITSTDSTLWVIGQLGTSLVVYAIDKGTNTATLKTTMTTTTGYDITAYDDDNVVFTHGSGAYSYLDSSGTFVTASAVGSSALTDFHMFDEYNWIALAATGLYATGDAGQTWQNRFSFSAASVKMAWFDTLTGYLLLPTSIYRSIDSGRTWKLVSTLVGEDAIDLAVSSTNANLFMAQTKTGITTYTYKSKIGN